MDYLDIIKHNIPRSGTYGGNLNILDNDILGGDDWRDDDTLEEYSPLVYSEGGNDDTLGKYNSLLYSEGGNSDTLEEYSSLVYSEGGNDKYKYKRYKFNPISEDSESSSIGDENVLESDSDMYELNTTSSESGGYCGNDKSDSDDIDSFANISKIIADYKY